MAEYTDVITRAQDSALTAIKQAEDTAVSAVAEWTERMAAMLPELPELPFANQVPQPREIVEINYTFLRRLLDTQKAYALGMLKALSPITDQVLPEPKKAPRATVKKSA